MNKFLNAAIKPWAHKRASPDGLAPSPVVPVAPVAPEIYSRVPILELVQQAEQMAELGFWRFDLDAEEVFWSPGVFDIYDLKKTDKVPIDNALCFYAPAHRPVIEAAINQAASEGTPWDLELDFVSARGKKKRVRAIGKAEMTDGRITALVGVFQDVTRRYLADQQLRDAAMTDELTGLPNRRHLHQFFQDLRLEKAVPDQIHYALALIDLDHFKASNDTYGHLIGDEVLKQTAERLQHGWLSNSFAARLGGDEFVLMIRDAHLLEELERTGERLLEQLARPINLRGETITASATIGIAFVEHEALPLNHLLSAADTMLYMAKKKQRGSCVIARGTDVFLDDARTFESIERGAAQARAGQAA